MRHNTDVSAATEMPGMNISVTGHCFLLHFAFRGQINNACLVFCELLTLTNDACTVLTSSRSLVFVNSYEQALQALADSEARRETSDKEMKLVS